jgi:hypothetical protein
MDDISEGFRKHAQQCLRLAQQACSLESRIHWTEMARIWCTLVRHAESEMIFSPVLLDDMARMWVAAASPLAEITGGRRLQYEKSQTQHVRIH